MLLRNSLWNLCGLALPAVVALATVPLLISGLGLEGFGIVALIGSVIGYFGVLDINLSAGSIKYLAQYHAQHEEERFAETFWFGWIFYGVLGITGAVILYFSAEFLSNYFFKISPALHAETALAFQIAALGFMISQAQNYLMVVPQALQRYDTSAKAEAFFGVITNILSAVVALTDGGIVGVIAVRVMLATTHTAWLIWVIHKLGVSLKPCWPRREIRKLMTGFSAYAYLSRLAVMMHTHGDKLIIGTLAGPVALSFYTVPAQLASRILGLTYRLSSVIFPRVSALAATGQQSQLRLLYLDTTRLLTYLNLMVLGVIALTGEEFLRRWVGEEFVATGYPVLVLITIGLLVDSLTNIPSLVNDGLGHPRVTGRFALARGLVGIAMIYAGTMLAGITGAAMAHLLASLFMSVFFLIYVHGRTIPISLKDTLRHAWLPSICTGGAAIILLLPFKWILPDSLIGTMLMASMAMLALIAAGLAFIVNTDERAAVWAVARKLYPGT